MPFFFYGTLLDAEVRRRVLGAPGRAARLTPAVLHGWRRVYVRGRTYPVVTPARGCRVEGLLAQALPFAAARRVRLFESDEYREIVLPVLTPDGAAVEARLFVARHPSLATGRPWTVEDWRRRHRAAFLERWRKREWLK